MSIESLAAHERIWVEGLNRGDVPVADAAFAPDCVVHLTGVPAPIHGVESWKAFVAGLLAPSGKAMAIDGLIVDHLVDGKVRERWEQWDQSLMLQQLGFA